MPALHPGYAHPQPFVPLPAYAFINASFVYARNFCKSVRGGRCVRTGLWMAFSLRACARVLRGRGYLCCF